MFPRLYRKIPQQEIKERYYQDIRIHDWSSNSYYALLNTVHGHDPKSAIAMKLSSIEADTGLLSFTCHSHTTKEDRALNIKWNPGCLGVLVHWTVLSSVRLPAGRCPVLRSCSVCVFARVYVHSAGVCTHALHSGFTGHNWPFPIITGTPSRQISLICRKIKELWNLEKCADDFIDQGSQCTLQDIIRY